jgi:hypothetical protein
LLVLLNCILSAFLINESENDTADQIEDLCHNWNLELVPFYQHKSKQSHDLLEKSDHNIDSQLNVRKQRFNNANCQDLMLLIFQMLLLALRDAQCKNFVDNLQLSFELLIGKVFV